MKRLYNKYGAAPCEGEVKSIDNIMSAAFRDVWSAVVLDNDVCPRDAESVCHSVISGLFAEHILRQATEMKREDVRKLLKAKPKDNHAEN